MEQVRANAIRELLRLISANTEASSPFLLRHRGFEAVDDWDEPTEYVFARLLQMAHTNRDRLAFNIAAGTCLPWDTVLAGIVRLAMGARLPTVQELKALGRRLPAATHHAA